MPSLTFSSFMYKKPKNEFTVKFTYQQGEEILEDDTVLISTGTSIYSEWTEKNIDYSQNKRDIERKKRNDLMHSKYDSITNDSFKELLEKLNSIEISRDTKQDSRNSFINKIMKYLFIPDDIYISLKNFSIYTANTEALRGVSVESRKQPLGIYGEGLDILIANLTNEERETMLEYTSLIPWLDEIIISADDNLKYLGYKLGRSNSRLYFKDKHMRRNNNIFSAENSNEGALHILFYLALFISKSTPSFFAIDNIESALNPSVCRSLVKEITSLAKSNNKQVLITTHNPAILDGVNLNDDSTRLFEVYRNDEGHTKTRRIKTKGENIESLKLSEMWLRGYIGAINEDF